MAQIFLNDWAEIIDAFGAPTTHTTTQLVLLNTDGLTSTVINGTGFTYDVNGFPITGTISSIDLVLNGGPVLQSLTNVSTGLGAIGSFLGQASALRAQVSWFGVIDQGEGGGLRSCTSTAFRLLNIDGTFTVAIGTGFSQAGAVLSGTVNTLEHFAADGTTLLPGGLTGLSVDLSVAASAIVNNVASEQTYMLANQGSNTLTGLNNEVISGADTIFSSLQDGPGSDTIIVPT